MVKIYFAGSIRGGREDAASYTKIIDMLQSYGEVLTEHIGNDKLLQEEQGLSDVEIHDRDMKWLNSSDVICAEVTQPSLGVGYELALAMKMNKKVLCLFNQNKKGKLSAMITGDKYYDIVYYSKISELEKVFHDYFITL